MQQCPTFILVLIEILLKRSLAGRLFTNVPRAINTSMKHLKPIIEERQKKIDEYGPDYPDKPVSNALFPSTSSTIFDPSLQIDFLSWLMDEAKGEEQSVRNLTLRVLIINFAAIHTTSMVCCGDIAQLPVNS